MLVFGCDFELMGTERVMYDSMVTIERGVISDGSNTNKGCLILMVCVLSNRTVTLFYECRFV